jgi:hypothetical protein
VQVGTCWTAAALRTELLAELVDICCSSADFLMVDAGVLSEALFKFPAVDFLEELLTGLEGGFSTTADFLVVDAGELSESVFLPADLREELLTGLEGDCVAADFWAVAVEPLLVSCFSAVDPRVASRGVLALVRLVSLDLRVLLATAGLVDLFSGFSELFLEGVVELVVGWFTPDPCCLLVPPGLVRGPPPTSRSNC